MRKFMVTLAIAAAILTAKAYVPVFAAVPQPPAPQYEVRLHKSYFGGQCYV